MDKKREIYFFKDYFEVFYEDQTDKVKKKIIWTLRIIEEFDRIPQVYLKYLKTQTAFMKLEFRLGIIYLGFSVFST